MNLKEKSRRTETTAAACKQVKDEAAATCEHAEGHNEATAVAGKRKNEAATSEHAEGCDEAAAAADKGRNEAFSSKEDVGQGRHSEVAEQQEW